MHPPNIALHQHHATRAKLLRISHLRGRPTEPRLTEDNKNAADAVALARENARLEEEIRKIRERTTMLKGTRRADASADPCHTMYCTSSPFSHVVPASLKAHLDSVGAETPLQLPEREFQLLHPIIKDHQIVWKYKTKPYWCEVLPGYSVELIRGDPVGSGWEEAHARNTKVLVNHNLKKICMQDQGPIGADSAPIVASATAAFEPRHSDELSFLQGDQIKIVGKAQDDGWFHGTLQGRSGLVPSTHLGAFNWNKVPASSKGMASDMAEQLAAGGQKPQRAAVPPPEPPSAPLSVHSIPSAPASPAPASKLEPPAVPPPPPPPPPPLPGPPAALQNNSKEADTNTNVPEGTRRTMARHKYQAREVDELSFAKYEELNVFPDSIEPGWFRGFNLSGQHGLIPSTHIDLSTLDPALQPTTASTQTTPRTPAPLNRRSGTYNAGGAFSAHG